MTSLELTKEEFDIVRLAVAKMLPDIPEEVDVESLKSLIRKFTVLLKQKGKSMGKGLEDLIRDEITRNTEAYIKDYMESALIGFIEDETKKVFTEVMGDRIRSIIVNCLRERLEKRVVPLRTIID